MMNDLGPTLEKVDGGRSKVRSKIDRISEICLVKPFLGERIVPCCSKTVSARTPVRVLLLVHLFFS